MYIFNSLSDYFHYISQNKSNHILKRLLFSLWGFSSDDFSNYNLSKRRFRRVINEFVPYYRRIHYRGNKECISFQILNNKFETIKLLKKHHIPTTTPRYIFSKKMGFLVDEQCQIISKATGILSGDYVLKPIHSRWGVGIERLLFNEQTKQENMIKIRNALNSYSDIFLENKETNHDGLSILSSSSLNTLRFVTVQTKKRGIEAIFACVRFSCNGSFIDNWSSGGFAANININTGIADTAQKKSSINSYNDISKGVIIPYFEDAKQIAIKAHGLFSDMKSIGWDIAITNEGPKLIEGNNDWDVILPQKLMQRGIKKILCSK